MDEDETKTKHSMTWTEYHSKEDIESYLGKSCYVFFCVANSFPLIFEII